MTITTFVKGLSFFNFISWVRKIFFIINPVNTNEIMIHITQRIPFMLIRLSKIEIVTNP
ncbi:hypothetical protein SAMN06265376_104422 [Dokdonia pacifica]|uniref:Uncharacterized protein n=1 Tax=Dokdonia pacifica TaxID=1627892 RepID=A0A239AGI4_9FLAO|nr:hypothetical protein SAMN06265376_104422 [Dokdonia pacifica]